MEEFSHHIYSYFAYEARKIERVNPSIADHDIGNAMISMRAAAVPYLEFIPYDYMEILSNAVDILHRGPYDELDNSISNKIADIHFAIKKVKIDKPPGVQFALIPEHHRFIYYLHNLWKEPENIHLIESLRQCSVDLPLLLETLGIQTESSCRDVRVSGVVAGVALSNAQNARKYSLKGTTPIARVTREDRGYQLCIANQSNNPHTPDIPYPHMRPIELGNRGSVASATQVIGTGTGAYAMKVLGLLDNAESHIWEMDVTSINGQAVFGYESRTSFSSYARGSA